jgi:sodium/bile acid cotransporter 7
MKKWFVDNWFMCGLVAAPLTAVIDVNEWTVGIGRMLKAHHGPDVIIVLIFFFSGWVLKADQIKSGLVDIRGTVTALAIIFVGAPLAAWIIGQLPMDNQIRTGLFIVAVMPSTLSSGVVMTAAAGGNMAHALMVTIAANSAAVLTIPITLSLLLAGPEAASGIEIDKSDIMLKIGLFVLVPLLAGLWTRFKTGPMTIATQKTIQRVNQALILTVVWMAVCHSRITLVNHLGALAPIGGMVFGFHLLVILIALTMVRLSGLPSGRRESVVLMGGQKTLPLSVIIQVSLFPDYGLALVVCVAHHIIHLIMDGYLVRRLRQWK